jgi:hypothetical protein
LSVEPVFTTGTSALDADADALVEDDALDFGGVRGGVRRGAFEGARREDELPLLPPPLLPPPRRDDRFFFADEGLA